jgi:hypothetical protein
MASIHRIAIANPNANTDTLVHVAEGLYLLSVIIANKSRDEQGLVDIWIAPEGTANSASFGYIAGALPVTPKNPYETFKFTMDIDDELYVRASTASVSFIVQGVNQGLS